MAAGFAREDLFTVVLEQFQTDTADYADYVLPATTQLEHVDVHKSYGHLYMLANNPAIAPLGEALPNSEIFRRLAARDGVRRAVLPRLRRRDRGGRVQPSRTSTGRALKQKRLATARPAEAVRAVRERRLPDEERQVRDLLGDARRARPRTRCRATSPPHESRSTTALAARYPLAMISPPARNFLNSTFVNVVSLRAPKASRTLEIHPHDAAARGIADGDRVRVFNDRGSLELKARVTDRARPGVVVALSVWWKKLARDGKNANELTSQVLTDIGRAPTFYDCLVEVATAP